jgi:hypothetical protein
VTPCPGAGELIGDLKPTIHQKQSISRLSLCPLIARCVPFSLTPGNGVYLQKIKELFTCQLPGQYTNNMEFHTT